MHTLKYQLAQKLTIAASGEVGEVVARSEHANSEPLYNLRYKNANGRAVQEWWGESALQLAADVLAKAAGPVPTIGAMWPEQGGIYVGVMRAFGDDQPQTHMVLAIEPEASFEDVTWGEYGQDVTGATSDHAGRANTRAMADAGSELAKRILALDIGGHKDWALMSRAEARLCMANVPDQFDASDWHWTSTQYSRDAAWCQHFGNGNQYYNGKDLYGCRARAVRRFVLE